MKTGCVPDPHWQYSGPFSCYCITDPFDAITDPFGAIADPFGAIPDPFGGLVGAANPKIRRLNIYILP